MANKVSEILVQINGDQPKKTLKDLRKEISDYKDELLNLNANTDKYNKTLNSLADAQRQIDSLNQAVKESVKGVNTEEQNNLLTVSSLRKEISSLRDSLLNLGEGTEEYSRALDELNAKQQRLDALNANIKDSNKDVEVTFLDVGKTAQSLAGGFAVLQSSVALLGLGSEDTQKTMVKLQSSIALMQGLDPIIKGAKSANVSFQAFNATLKANPILFIVGLVAGLIAVLVKMKNEFTFITEPIEGAWNAIKDLLPSLDQLTQFVNGVGTAIVRFYSGPLKALVKALQGDFAGAVEEAKKGFDVMGNFDDGYTEKAQENIQKRKDAISESNAHLSSIAAKNIKIVIDENEAKYGADWKYTEAGRKLYASYFSILQSSYKKDSDGYRGALNQKYAFDRDYKSKIDTAAKTASDKAKSEREKAETEAKKQREEQEKAQKEYADTIVAIESDKEERVTDAYKGDLRIEFLKTQISANEELQKKLLENATNESASWQDRVKYAKEYQQTLSENFALTNEFNALQKTIDAENQLQKEREIELTQMLNEIENPENLSDEDKIEKLKDEAAAYWEVATDINASYEERIAAIASYNKSMQESAALNKKIKEDEKKLNQATLSATSGFLDASSKLVGENTVAGKSMAVASAIINTYLGATMALASFPPPASYVAMAATIASGMATVASIMSTKVPGASDTSGSVSAKSVMPEMPGMDANFMETHNNMDAYDEEVINSTQTVLVVEDANQVQARVQVAENKATF